MKGLGTIVSIEKWRGGMFFILGDDGVTYFSHRMRLVDDKGMWKYCWNGNKCTFDIVDEGKEHLVAENVRPYEVPDPKADEKKAKREEDKIRRKEKEEKRVENIARQRVLKDRADKRREYESEHLKYVIQVFKDGEWINAEPLRMFCNSEQALSEKNAMKGDHPRVKYRVKKYMVHALYGKTIFKDVK